MGKRRLMFASAAVVAGTIGVGGVATARGSHEHFFVRLQGAQETQDADRDGRATARLDIDTDSGKICWDLHWNRIGTPTMAHIHEAAAGAPGPVRVLFFDPQTPTDLDRDRLEITNHASGCATSALAADIAENPTNYYVNIHNARFPNGAVRGQMG